MICSHCRRQIWPIAAYLRPHEPSSKASKALRPARKPFQDHLPRERVVIPTPQSCPCCGSAKLSKLGEDITETLEVVPRPCASAYHAANARRSPSRPFHVTPRGFAGPNLLPGRGPRLLDRDRRPRLGCARAHAIVSVPARVLMSRAARSRVALRPRKSWGMRHDQTNR
jgi:hypothetical protein